MRPSPFLTAIGASAGTFITLGGATFVVSGVVLSVAKRVVRARKLATAQPCIMCAGSGFRDCQVCWVFKRRANELEKLVLESVPEAEFAINPEKPRKGCFEVRRGDKTYVSLLSLPRPFTKLRELEMGEVAAAIVADLGGGSGDGAAAAAAEKEPAAARPSAAAKPAAAKGKGGGRGKAAAKKAAVAEEEEDSE
ncbi:Seleno H [Micractinium conductrix]|uniref:Seleno H n=1 Tax=Micractinium conductrix TaxID=554055 RepID=A0A2P6V4K8_9CHLO|nr:Seleno H [Micractinium conductrix]|eukprot:PSC69014.1 Seleno H [Micractinium conductrix]